MLRPFPQRAPPQVYVHLPVQLYGSAPVLGLEGIIASCLEALRLTAWTRINLQAGRQAGTGAVEACLLRQEHTALCLQHAYYVCAVHVPQQKARAHKHTANPALYEHMLCALAQRAVVVTTYLHMVHAYITCPALHGVHC